MRVAEDRNRRTVAGALLTGGSLLVLVAAGLPDWRVFTSPDRHAQLEAVAARRWGWTAQAVLFPTAFGLVGAGLASAAPLRQLRRRRRARLLARLAALLGGASALLWVPISVERLRTGARVDELLARPPEELSAPRSPTFWPYTACAVGATGCLGAALAWSGISRRTGTTVAALAGGALVTMPLLGDWPPFATYLMVLPLGIALLVRRRGRR